MRNLEDGFCTEQLESMQRTFNVWDEGSVYIPPPVYLCDCHGANVAFFGEEAVPKRTTNLDRPYQRVPTVTTVEDTCVHCGHYAYLGNADDVAQAENFKASVLRRKARTA